MKGASFEGSPRMLGKQGRDREAEVGKPSPQSLSLHVPYRCPKSSGLTRAQIESVAEVWAQRGLDRSSPDWLKNLVTESGGEIRPDPTSRLLVVAVRTNCFVISTEQPWSVAEALGHVALHLEHLESEKGVLPMLAVQLATPVLGDLARARAEAGWFAATFLLPATLVTESWKRHQGSLRDMALELRAPRAMVASRIERLGLR